MRWRVLALLIAALGLSACDVGSMLLGLRDRTKQEKPVAITFEPLTYATLPGWESDDHAAALTAFQASCKIILSRKASRPMGGYRSIYGTAAHWQKICQVASRTLPVQARLFFEREFRPIEIQADASNTGLFTGYYEPELRGSRTKTPAFQTPLYRRPSDIVLVDLGDFRESLKGERISGRVVDGRLKPYFSRAEITQGGLKGVAEPLVYIDDAFEAFSIQIQGSGRVRLSDGSIIRLNYDGQNGHPYTAIGRRLVDRGAIRKEDLSMQSIKAWLKANPKKAADVMNINASYVFFKEELIGNPLVGAPGAMDVALLPERSLAIDLRFHALGAPLWIDATRPADKPGEEPEAFRHLMIAHDTGGAIRGPIRGDVYWGAGARAEELAGRMANRGRLVVLLPPALAKATQSRQ